MRLYFNNIELENPKNLEFYNILTSKGNIINLKLKHEIGTANAYVDVYGSMQYSKNVQKMIDHIRQGFNSGLKPKLTDDGTSGAYELRNP